MKEEEQEKFLQSLVENILVGIYLLREDGTLVYVNERFAEIFGYSSPNQLVGKEMYSVVHPRDYVKVKENIRRCFDGKASLIYYEFTALKKDGTEIEVGTQGSLMKYGGRPAMGGVLVDLTGYKRKRERTRHLDAVLRAIRRIDQLIAKEKDESRLLQRICDLLLEVGSYKVVWIGLIDEKDGKIVPVAQSGFEKGYLESLEDFSILRWPDEEAIRTDRPYIMENILEEPKFSPWRKEAIKGGYLSSIAVPLISEGKVYGAINVCSDQREFFDEEEITLLEEVSSDISYALRALRLERERNKLQKNLTRSFESMAQTVIKMLGQRDPYTATHSRRVAEFARLVAEEMGFSRNRVYGVWIGGILHDVGKIGIPETILVKPGRLSPQEMALIRTHPERGYEILKDMHFPWPVAEMALQHHERLNGTGYPKGIKGEDIILEARILAVCDVLEAMPSHRPYRPAKSQKKTLEEIEKGRGTKYDPKVVDVAIKLVEEGKIHLSQ